MIFSKIWLKLEFIVSMQLAGETCSIQEDQALTQEQIHAFQEAFAIFDKVSLIKQFRLTKLSR